MSCGENVGRNIVNGGSSAKSNDIAFITFTGHPKPIVIGVENIDCRIQKSGCIQ